MDARRCAGWAREQGKGLLIRQFLNRRFPATVMTPGLLFALGAMLLFGVSDLIYKRAAAAGIGAAQFVMLQAWVFAPTVNLYAWATGTLDVHGSAVWGSLAGLFSLVAFYNFARSLKDGAVSTNAPIFRLNFTLTAAMAIILLGETFTLTKAGALACALVAVWLLLAEPGAVRGQIGLASLTRVLIATVAMAFANLFYKIGLQHGALPETMVAAQAWAFSSLATVLCVVQEKRLRLMPQVWPYSTPAAFALLIGFILLLHGLALGSASVLVPVAQMSFVFTAIVGVLLFGEKLNGRKRFGLLIATAAFILFAVS
jgi:drug/metabolite transporter (DMT)-like permease